MARGRLGYSADDYYKAMKALLPRGPAWELDDHTTLMSMLYVAAQEFSQIDALIKKLIDESDPRDAQVTLSEWFTQWGIPDECLKNIDNPSIDLYRKVLVTKIATLGMSFGELVALIARSLDYQNVSIQNFNTFTTRSNCSQALYDDDWKAYFMTITVDKYNKKEFTTAWDASRPLAEWGDQLFECMVKSLAPCHANVIFLYGKSEL